MTDKKFDTTPKKGFTHVRSHTRTMHDGTIVDVTDYLRRNFVHNKQFQYDITSASISYNPNREGGGIIDVFVSPADAIEDENWEFIESDLYTAIQEIPNIQIHGRTWPPTIADKGIQFQYYVSEVEPGVKL